MFFIAYRNHSVINSIVKLLQPLQVKVLEGEDYWAGIVPATCCKEEEDLLVCDDKLIDAWIREHLDEIIKYLERIVKQHHDEIGAVIVSSAPVLWPWGPIDLAKASLYAAWLSFNIPKTRAEEIAYRVTTLLIQEINPILGIALRNIPFIDVKEVAKLLGNRVKVIANGILIEQLK